MQSNNKKFCSFVTNVNPFADDSNREDVKILPVDQPVFLSLCKIRNEIEVKDLACLLNLKVHSVSIMLDVIYKYLKYLMEQGYLHPGDSIMADKDFRLLKTMVETGSCYIFSLLFYATVGANLYMEVQQGPHSIQGVYNAVQCTCTPTLWHDHKFQEVYP